MGMDHMRRAIKLAQRLSQNVDNHVLVVSGSSPLLLVPVSSTFSNLLRLLEPGDG
jgi:predicted glycosyltransferase